MSANNSPILERHTGSSSSYSNSDSEGNSSGDEGSKGNKRVRERISEKQRLQLEEYFKWNNHPNKKQRAELTQEVQLQYKQITKWFQNQRYKSKNDIINDSNSPTNTDDSLPEHEQDPDLEQDQEQQLQPQQKPTKRLKGLKYDNIIEYKPHEEVVMMRGPTDISNHESSQLLQFTLDKLTHDHGQLHDNNIAKQLHLEVAQVRDQFLQTNDDKQMMLQNPEDQMPTSDPYFTTNYNQVHHLNMTTNSHVSAPQNQRAPASTKYYAWFKKSTHKTKKAVLDQIQSYVNNNPH